MLDESNQETPDLKRPYGDAQIRCLGRIVDTNAPADSKRNVSDLKTLVIIKLSDYFTQDTIVKMLS